jgi:putative transcriptional regulator
MFGDYYTLDLVHTLCYNADSGEGGFFTMPIVYTKLFDLLKEKGYTTYRIRQEKLIGQGTLTAIKNGTGGLDAKTIARLCEVLDCQPGDIMEYLKEEQPE